MAYPRNDNGIEALNVLLVPRFANDLLFTIQVTSQDFLKALGFERLTIAERLEGRG